MGNSFNNFWFDFFSQSVEERDKGKTKIPLLQERVVFKEFPKEIIALYDPSWRSCFREILCSTSLARLSPFKVVAESCTRFRMFNLTTHILVFEFDIIGRRVSFGAAKVPPRWRGVLWVKLKVQTCVSCSDNLNRSLWLNVTTVTWSLPSSFHRDSFGRSDLRTTYGSAELHFSYHAVPLDLGQWLEAFASIRTWRPITMTRTSSNTVITVPMTYMAYQVILSEASRLTHCH